MTMRKPPKPDSKGGGQATTMSFQNTTTQSPIEGERARGIAESAALDRRFYVRAPSVSAVRRALFRAPGGARVVGRHDRETIECSHTMDPRSFARHWPIIVSRLDKAGLAAMSKPAHGAPGLDG